MTNIYRYGSCEYCGWAGLLRKDGLMRRHRPQRDSGKSGPTGSRTQDMGSEHCKGSLAESYKPMHEVF